MNQSSLLRQLKLSSDHLTGGAILILTFVVFWCSPVHQVTDSAYSLLLSESLLRQHTFALDHYGLSAADVQSHWQLESVNNHVYYFYSPGSSVLSVPFVALMHAFHLTAVNDDGAYAAAGEVKMQAMLAALLMAALCCIFFYTARLLLPLSWSLLIALSGGLGTQVWSTASRALWSHTWELVLLGVVIWLVLAQETGRRKLRPVVLASLLAWMYFVRPTSAIFIVAITIYLLVFQRALFLQYAITGFLWFVGFVVYSWLHFGQLLPRYYVQHLGRVSLHDFSIGLLGNLISPSRGLFVYCPVVLFVFYVLARRWKHVVLMRLALLAVFVVAAHFIIISAFGLWWGGGCFGARMTTDLVPWFVLLAILSVQAMRQSLQDSSLRSLAGRRMPLVFGALLLALSVFVNARGALSWETWLWYSSPLNRDGNLLWEWRYPQFLAGLIHPPPPTRFLPAPARLELGSIAAEPYLWYGWSGPESPTRWTDGHEATVVFALDDIVDTELQLRCTPFLAFEKVSGQRVNIDLNGQRVTTLTLRDPGPRTYSVALPAGYLRPNNVLRFGLLDAVSPLVLNTGEDQRTLGISVEWIAFVKETSGNSK